ncbi:isoprenylcysteine carboxylmethyltransferase family protein [Sphingomonas sp. 28-63-12]|uniref:methyltransferase family protein n=1 Tax=Sphingomonas sp. 28-63-12 TaxID=1970434 RepID=UPI000BCE8C8E|nr:MAG: isoprenylcysteine carboxyl methyltransferase [Sphingomonas sp. 28-63-12]
MMPISDPVGAPGLVALALGFVLFAVALIAARRRGQRDAAEGSGRRANSSILWIVLQGVAIGLAGFGPIHIGLDPLSPAGLTCALIVLALMLGAVFLFDWSSRAMGRNWALVARTRGDASLVTTGPFAYVRNPIYVALALFMIAMAIAYGHARMLVIAAPLYALATWMRVAVEEKLLRAEFGAAYIAYTARVKRFVPGIL